MKRQEGVVTLNTRLNTQKTILFNMKWIQKRVAKLFITVVAALSPLTIPFWGLTVPLLMISLLIFLLYTHYIFVGVISLRLVLKGELEKFSVPANPYLETFGQFFVILIPHIFLILAWYENYIDLKWLFYFSVIFILLFLLPLQIPLSSVQFVKRPRGRFGFAYAFPIWQITWVENKRWFILFTISVMCIVTYGLIGFLFTPFTLLLLYWLLGKPNDIRNLINVFHWYGLLGLAIFAVALLNYHLRADREGES